MSILFLCKKTKLQCIYGKCERGDRRQTRPETCDAAVAMFASAITTSCACTVCVMLGSVLECVAVCCNTRQHTTTHCSTLQHRPCPYRTRAKSCQLQHTATHCNTLQHRPRPYRTRASSCQQSLDSPLRLHRRENSCRRTQPRRGGGGGGRERERVRKKKRRTKWKTRRGRRRRRGAEPARAARQTATVKGLRVRRALK